MFWRGKSCFLLVSLPFSCLHSVSLMFSLHLLYYHSPADGVSLGQQFPPWFMSPWIPLIAPVGTGPTGGRRLVSVPGWARSPGSHRRAPSLGLAAGSWLTHRVLWYLILKGVWICLFFLFQYFFFVICKWRFKTLIETLIKKYFNQWKKKLS